jgi:hypothetical protein
MGLSRGSAALVNPGIMRGVDVGDEAEFSEVEH